MKAELRKVKSEADVKGTVLDPSDAPGIRLFSVPRPAALIHSLKRKYGVKIMTVYLTHIWHRISTIIRYLIWIICVGFFYIIAAGITGSIRFGPAWLKWIIFVALFWGSLYLVLKLLSGFFDRLDILEAFLYIRINLKTKISFNETKRIAWLFLPNATGKWWPLKDIRKLPENIRKNTLFNAAKEMASTIGK